MPSRSRGHEFLRCQSIKASLFYDWFSQVQPPARAGVCGLAAVGVSGSVRPATGRWPAEADLDRRSAPAPGRHQHHDGDVTLWPYTQRGAVAPCWRCSGSTGAGPGPADGGHGREVQPACDTAVTWPPCPENRRQPDSLWPGHPAEPERQRLPADRNTGRARGDVHSGVDGALTPAQRQLFELCYERHQPNYRSTAGWRRQCRSGKLKC